ncbi:unnamed protein product [Mytilus edulis]|uniref:Myb/SANT-like DNA-binding domain-containing protein n=1 Tax=Mytilus edulis TaxID=6550 RepID=A0A8S3VEX9_MYTED|nr:unnamed protein product [Mytilus edulis]
MILKAKYTKSFFSRTDIVALLENVRLTMSKSSILDFDNPSRLTDDDYYNLTGLTRQQFEDLSTYSTQPTYIYVAPCKTGVWKTIACQINALGLHCRTGKEVKTKWQNLQSKAKTQYAEKNKYSKQTGGGPAPKPMSNETEKIVEMMKDCSSFVGLNGCESSVILVTSEGAYSFLFKFSDRVALKVKNKGNTHSNSLNYASADQYL